MPSSPDFRLVLGSSAEATVLASDLVGQIALAVTSPPYHNAISYESHAADPDANYRTRDHIDYATEYLPFIGDVWNECWTMLAPGGYLAVNVGSVLEDGYHYPLPQDVIHQLVQQKGQWNFVRSIVWHKVTAGVKRAGSVIKHKLPGYWYPNIMTEHIIVVQKPGAKRKLNKDVPSEWWEDVWDLAPVPPKNVAHPAPFPEEIPHRLTRMLTAPGEWVMDPFNGAGASSKAAYDLGRRALGFDIERKYIELANKRIFEASRVRGEQLRIVPTPAKDFQPKSTRNKGKTRHGAGKRGKQTTG